MVQKDRTGAEEQFIQSRPMQALSGLKDADIYTLDVHKCVANVRGANTITVDNKKVSEE